MLPYRRFSVTPGVVTFGEEYTGGELVKTLAYFSLVDASLVDGMDEACRAVAPYSLSIAADNVVPQITEYNLARGIRPNYFTLIDYPEGYPPASGDAVFHSYAWLGPAYVNQYQADLMNTGIFFRMGNYEPGGPDSEGEKIQSNIGIGNIKVYYFNPVVSSFSHYALRTSEQVDFVITGLGFNQNNAEIDEGGFPYPAGWKSYVTEIEFWQIGGTGGGDWEDDFEDGIRDPTWTDAPRNGTIDEATGLLTFAFGGGVPAGWGGGLCPYSVMTPAENEVIIETKLNSYTVNDDTWAGLYIHDHIDPTGGISFTRYRNDSAPAKNGIRLWRLAVGELAYAPVTTLPIWLRIVATGPKASATLKFYYSTNGTDWTLLHTEVDEAWDIVALYGANWGVNNALSAPFEFFKYSWEAQPVSFLKLTDGDFTLDSDTKITIPEAKFPSLSTGTYRIKLRKTLIEIASDLAEGYAGAWRPDGAGLCTAGAAFILRVGLMPSIGVRGKAKALPLTCFTWKNKLGETYEDCVAPIDIRAPETFYDGRIIDISSVTRAIDHRTGLFQISDMTIRLVNTDKKYSKLLANWFLKNQPINLWLATGFEPESDKFPIVGMIVEDYYLQGTQFVIKLKDITQKYFKKKVPPRICTALTFPQIHPDEVGKAFPEVLGLCVLGTAFEDPGAIRAIYTDTLVWEYLAANGELYFVSNVFSDGEPKSPPADYSIVYRDGCTFIKFTGDQVDKKITFNARGYSVAGLNSVNGHVQNPAYIILYYLSNILEVPDELLNITSFDALASKYDDLGVGESGKLIIQTRQDSMEVLRQLLFSYGVHGFPANDGRFVVERKDITNYATETFLFDQIDLMDSPLREFNLTEAINTIKARWDYIPWQRLFKDAGEDYKDNKFEADMEDDVRMPREREDRRTRWL